MSPYNQHGWRACCVYCWAAAAAVSNFRIELNLSAGFTGRGQAVTSQNNASVELKYRPLREDHPLGLLEDACLPMRTPRYATCRACENVCPVKAIHIGEAAIQLDENSVRW